MANSLDNTVVGQPESMARLAGCVALVTGASSGIGAATALDLAAQGAAVVLVARRAERLHGLATQIEERGGRAIVMAADITDATATEQIVIDTVERLGRLDVLVNAAGVMLNGSALKRPLSEWQQMINLNLSALLAVTKAALPHLVDAAKGARGVADVINISSIAGRVPNATVAVYNATKFGVTAFSEALRQEFAPHNVRVSCVEPGAVETELFNHQDAAAQARLNERLAGVEKLQAQDVSTLITHIITLPRRVALAEVVIRPTDQI